MSADDLLENGIIDCIVPEPFGGAHRDYAAVAANLKKQVLEAFDELCDLSGEDLVRCRVDKFGAMGEYVSAY